MATKRRNRGNKKIIIILIAVVLFGVAALTVRHIMDYSTRQYLLMMHPMEYTELVEEYSSEFGVDKYLIYAIIKTESSFRPDSVSNVGARGLMQIMEDTFDWIQYRLDDEESVYDDMFSPEVNIRYGTYLVSYLLKLFEDQECAVAAYHAGPGNVGAWLEKREYSADGVTLDSIPIADTAHYVDKIDKAYNNYVKLYNTGG